MQVCLGKPQEGAWPTQQNPPDTVKQPLPNHFRAHLPVNCCTHTSLPSGSLCQLCSRPAHGLVPPPSSSSTHCSTVASEGSPSPGGFSSLSHFPTPLLQVFPSPPKLASCTQILTSRVLLGKQDPKPRSHLQLADPAKPKPGRQEGLQGSLLSLPAPHPHSSGQRGHIHTELPGHRHSWILRFGFC